MSYLTFKEDIISEDLNMERFQKIFEHFNLKNKASLIDQLTQHIGKCMYVRATDNRIDLVVIAKNDIQKIVQDFEDQNIRAKIKHKKPYLEDIPSVGKSPHITTDCKWNAISGIVFKEMDVKGKTTWVAIQVIVGNKAYDLRMKHIFHCISNGWYFWLPENNQYPTMSSVFRVNNT